MINPPYFKDLFLNSNFHDDFGWSQEWNNEIEKWLIFANSINKKWYQNNKSRTQSDKQRDELLGEYKSLYYIGNITGVQILEVEPQGKSGKKNDFLFKDKNLLNWYVEVKSPSWRGEVSKEIDNSYLQELRKTIVIVHSSQWPKCNAEITCPNCSQIIIINFETGNQEYLENVIKKTVCKKCKKNIWHHSENERTKLKKQRLSQPQFITGEGRSFSDKDAVEDAVKKSIKQFAPEKNNLLIISHNMLAGLGIGLLSSMDGGYSIKQVVNKYDTNKLISCICLLSVQLDDKGVNFITVFVPMTKQPSL